MNLNYYVCSFILGVIIRNNLVILGFEPRIGKDENNIPSWMSIYLYSEINIKFNKF
jgi:hypothetical protein